MSALPETVWVRIEGEPFRERAIAFKAAELECRRAWGDYGRSMGASAVPACFVGSRPPGLTFPGKPPVGWLTPARGTSYSKPGKKNEAAREAMAALPVRPRPDEIFGEALIEEVHAEGPGQSAWGTGGCIGHLFEGPRIGWAGDVIFALIPHAGNAAANAKARSPEITVTNGADAWTVPTGLVEVSKAEIDLLVAEYQVAAERKAVSRRSASPALEQGEGR